MWTSFEIGFLTETYRRVPTSAICRYLRRPRAKIHSMAKKLGVSRRVKSGPRRAWTRREDLQLISKYGSVRPDRIARTLDRSRSSIYHRAEDLGLASRLGSSEFLRRQSLPRTGAPFSGFRKPVHLGYVAGIIDGEGSVARPPDLTISVSSTDKGLALKLRELAGGNVGGPYLYGRTKVFGTKVCTVKPQYHWTFDSKYQAYFLLKALLPHLVVKRAVAKRAIEYLENKYGWGVA